MNDNRLIIEFITPGTDMVSVRRQGMHKPVLAGDARIDPKQPLDVVLVLPRRQVILKYFTLPAQDPAEIRRMVHLRIGQGLPFPVEEMLYDIAIGDVNAEGYTRVIAAIVRKETVERYLTMAAQHHLRPSHCAVSAFGTAAWLSHNFPSLNDQTILVADAGSDGFDLCFCRSGNLLFARSLSFPANDKVAETVRQCHLTLETFNKEYPGVNVHKIIVTGVPQRREFIKSVCDGMDMPMEESDNGGDASQWSNGSLDGKNTRVSLNALWGLAKADDTGPNLVPSTVIDAQSLRVRQAALIRLGVAILLLGIALSIHAGMDMYRRGHELDIINQHLASIATEAKAAHRDMALYQIIQNNAHERILIADLMTQLYAVTPDGTTFNSMQYANGTLTLQGLARQSQDVNALQHGMMGAALFKDVTLHYANRSLNPAIEYTEFRISCSVRHDQKDVR